MQPGGIGDTLILGLVDGSTLECRSRPLRSAGVLLGSVLSFRDLSETLRSQRQIERLLTTDRLTGLPSRQAFARQVAEMLAQRATAPLRHEGLSARRLHSSPESTSGAMLLIGLDRFRTINDTLGTQTGDTVLVEIARRLQASVGRADQIARLGGDEFAVRLDRVDARAAESVARRLLATVAEPLEVHGTRFTLTASVGISLIDPGLSDVDTALQEAGAALRRAKEAGRATFRFHQARHNIDLRERLRIDQAMREGLPAGDFRLAVQPQFDLATQRLVGAEALLRWRDPVLGEVTPARFIPLAEDNGFIVDLGQWVLEQAAFLAAGWMRSGHPLPISVNVSALQFRQPDFVDRVLLALDRSGLPPHLLELELTESILVDDIADAQARLAEFKALGVQLALDDFGTGYSSLAYLRDLPLTRLKLDRSFVAPLPASHAQAAIVRAVVQMAQALGIDVVAEGIENHAQADFLRGCGCPTAQGFLFGKPMEPLRLVELLETARAAATTPSPALSARPVTVHGDLVDEAVDTPAAPARRRVPALSLVKA
jgi:diguanylate cyclase (GGDEF)-like protein